MIYERYLMTPEYQLTLVFNNPLHGLASLKLHRLRCSGVALSS